MAHSDGPEYCGVGIRAVALAVDAIVWFGAFFVATLSIGALTGDLQVTGTGVNAHLTGLPGFAALALWLALSLGYHTVTEATYGKTAGKHLVKIEVTTGDGSRPTMMAALGRNLARLVDFLPAFYLLGMALVARSEYCQRLGDRLVGTVVVRS